MQKLDLMSIMGLVLGATLLVSALYLGGNMSLFWSFSAVLITVFGSLAALMINFGTAQIKSVVATTRHVLTTQVMPALEVIEILTDMARKARREGLLALEDDISRIDDAFFAKGVQMMVDAIDPEVIRDILETDLEYTEQRHRLGQNVYRTWGTLAPAFGMIGTLIGLIQMLANLDDPSALGPSMAVALITTFYGAVMANLVFIPMAGKLALRSEEELLLKRVMLEGIIAIQSGMNPRILELKLMAFLSPKEIQTKENQQVGSQEEGVLDV